MDLYVVRHAIAFARDPKEWPDDRDRPLTSKGRSRFNAAARGLKELAPRVEKALSSPLVRAWQTAEILEEAAGWPAAARFEALEPGRTPEEVVAALAAHASAASLALVGHEPLLGELISYLLSGDGARVSFDLKKGSVTALRIDTLQPGSATLLWLATPRMMRTRF